MIKICDTICVWNVTCHRYIIINCSNNNNKKKRRRRREKVHYVLHVFSNVDNDNDDCLQPENVTKEHLSLELYLRLHVFLLFGIQRSYAGSHNVPHHGHFQQNLGRIPLCSTSQFLVLQRVPSLFAVSYLQKRYGNFSEKLHLVVPVLVVYRHLQHRINIFHVAVITRTLI